MKSIKENWKKITVIVLVSVIVDILLHQIIPITMTGAFPPSIFVERGWFPQAVSIALIVTFGALAAVFVLIQKNLPGKNYQKVCYMGFPLQDCGSLASSKCALRGVRLLRLK